ncbi:MAG: GDSL-type esterase/lipase family protein, partial [Flammeovirgaceae bacterium]|nr:GDSL-type esterase/lipase family protein [Flammeovirgaceae bacterium]
NDAMQGIPLPEIRHNLKTIIKRIREKKNPKIYLVELKAFENMYSPYGDELAQLYRNLAREENVTLLPFFLEGVADNPRLNMADGIHPTAEGMAIVANNAWRALEPYLLADKQK